MTAVTIGNTAAIPANTAAKTAAKSASVSGKSLFARLFATFIEARMRQADREIALHRHLLPRQLQVVGERLAPRSEKDLPFVR
jgi:hypothetical protein